MTVNCTRPFARSIAILLLSSCCFGFWFKYSQLSLVTRQLISVYPILYWLYTCFILFFLFCIFWVFTGVFYKRFFRDYDLTKVMLWDSLSYLFFTLTAVNIPLKFCFFLFLAYKPLSLFFLSKKFKLRLIDSRLTYKLLSVFFFYGIIFTLFMGFISPFSWWNPLAVYGHNSSGTGAVGTLLHRMCYVNAKFFDFSGFDYSYFGTISHGVSTLYSPFFSALTLLFDLPSIDVASFHRLSQIIYFFLCIISSFGFFLFVMHGLRLSFFTAFLGGLLYILANSFFITGLRLHFLFFSGGFLILPYTFLLLRLAFRKNNLNYALFSGLIFSLQYYIFPGHPDASIHSFMIFLAYSFFHTLLNDEVKPLRRLYIFLFLALGFVIGSSLYLGPIVEAMLLKEFSCWGHCAKGLTYPSWTGFSIMLEPAFRIYGIFIMLGLILNRCILKNREHCFDYLFFMAAFISFLLFFLPGQHGFFSDLVSRYSKTIYFSTFYRVFMYFSLSGLVLALFGLHYMFKNKKNKYLKMLTLLYIIGLLLIYYLYGIGGIKASREMLIEGAIFLAIISWFSKVVSEQYEKYVKFAILAATIYMFFISSDIVRLNTAIFMENPRGNKPYITIQALLNNYRNLKNDPANEKYIKNRLLSFENDPGLYKSRYAAAYYSVLKGWGFSTIARADSYDALRIASCVYPVIDEYYLTNDKLYLPAFPVDGHDQGLISDYNNVSVLQNIGDRYQRILIATGTDSFMGVGEGFFIHDGTWTADSRFMIGHRPLSALYLIPGTYYENTDGNYDSPRAWSFNTDIIKNGLSRKILNISGIGVYVFNEREFYDLAEKDKEDIEQIDYSMPSKVKPPFVVVKDKRSYGMAYLANRITLVGAHTHNLYNFSPPFSKQNPLVFEAYRQEVDKCRGFLNKLRDKHDIIIERDDNAFKPKATGDEALPSKNKMEIINILGNKAVFAVDCMHAPCVLVLNYAAINGWKAFCDGKPVRINKANFAFMAVDVPCGKHLIWFEHRRPSVVWGSIITLLGYLCCGVIFLAKNP